MNNNFFETKLPKIQDKLSNWWEFGDQKNPCILITLPPENNTLLPDTNDLDKWWRDTDFTIDRQMILMEQQRYFGQAVPFHYIDCSSSAMAGVLGARMQLVNKETMWAYPCFESVEEVIEMPLARDTFWYQQAKTLTERSVDLAYDHHFVSLFAMEGITDILAGLYGTENFLVDLISKPEQVKTAAELVKGYWIDLFKEFQAYLNRTGNRGHIGWAGIWAPGSHFPLQEDFSYMISNEMFREFVLPHLLDMIDVMEYPLYHLDGIGAIPHLDTLLQIRKLKAIQWVPGAGKERLSQWYELIRKILAGGKSVQVFADVDEIDDLVAQVGARGLLVTVQNADAEQAQKIIDKYSE